ncbi:MAG TPA: dienelactone hydrolase family protein [Armatimonadota bacterium]|jgi:carboxymethylenebutenolidase
MGYQPGEKTADGYLALPPTGAGPGVLVLHAWWGLNDFFTGLCDRLAGEGFVALAPDLNGGAIASAIPEAEALRAKLDEDAAGGAALRGLDALAAHPSVLGDRIGVLGCSMGAWWAVQMSALRPEQVAAAVLFYGAGEADFTAARSAYLGHFAETDPWDPVEYALAMEEKMRAAGREVTLHVYPGAGHWFIESNRPDSYNPEAAELAWARTLSFLKDRLGAAVAPPQA